MGAGARAFLRYTSETVLWHWVCMASARLLHR